MSLIRDNIPTLLAFASGILVGRLIYLDKSPTTSVSLPDRDARQMFSPQKQ